MPILRLIELLVIVIDRKLIIAEVVFDFFEIVNASLRHWTILIALRCVLVVAWCKDNLKLLVVRAR